MASPGSNLHITGGINAHVFQPPKSPASTFTSPACATSATLDYFGPLGSRKRSRAVSSNKCRSSASSSRRAQCVTPGGASYTSGYAQDRGTANEDYRLAGGFDTPGILTGSELDQQQLHFGPLARERNGAARLQNLSNTLAANQPSWTGMAFNFVGKCFSFGTNMFRGFYAGGGKGYAMPDTSPFDPRGFSVERCPTPVPGAWKNDEDFLEDFEQDNLQSPSSGPTRPINKRRHTDRESWVMVGTPELEATGSRRKQPGADTPTRHTIAARPAASRASSRKNLVPQSRRRSSDQIFTPANPAQLQVPLSPTRRASYAPMRSSPRASNSAGTAFASGANAAYVSPEAEKYVRRKAKHDKQADSAIGDMSRKLADLIRQGQEALGTKYSVEGGGYDDEDEDEGFVDEEW